MKRGLRCARRALLQRFTQQPLREWPDQPGAFRQRNELIRWHQPFRALPAHQGLGAHHAAGSERHLWRVLAEPALEVRISLCAPLSATGKERRVLANLTRDQILCALKLKGEQVADGLASARAL